MWWVWWVSGFSDGMAGWIALRVSRQWCGWTVVGIVWVVVRMFGCLDFVGWFLMGLCAGGILCLRYLCCVEFQFLFGMWWLCSFRVVVCAIYCIATWGRCTSFWLFLEITGAIIHICGFSRFLAVTGRQGSA